MAPHPSTCMAPPLGIRGLITRVVILLTGVDNQIIGDTVLTTSARGLITKDVIPTINFSNSVTKDTGLTVVARATFLIVNSNNTIIKPLTPIM